MKSVIILFFVLIAIFDSYSYSKESKEILLETFYELENSTLPYYGNETFYENTARKIKDITIDEKLLKSLSDEEFMKVVKEIYSIRYVKSFNSNWLRPIYMEAKERKNKRAMDYMVRSYVELRKFKELKKLHNDELINNMIIDEPDGREIDGLVYELKGIKEARLINLDIKKGKHIFLIIALSCSESERFIDSIVVNKKALKIFKKYGNIITSEFAPESILFSKLHYGLENIYVAYSYDSFKNLNLDEYPTIYFIDNGKILYQKIGYDRDSINKFIESAEKYNMIVKDDEDEVNISIESKPVPTFGEYLAKMGGDDIIKLLEGIKVKRGIITYFDYNILLKYYKGEEFVKIYDIFKPLQIRLDEVRNEKEVQLKDVVSGMERERKEKFLKSLQVRNGILMGVLYFKELSDKEQEKVKCDIFGDCTD